LIESQSYQVTSADYGGSLVIIWPYPRLGAGTFGGDAFGDVGKYITQTCWQMKMRDAKAIIQPNFDFML
jgi:hypothetical protein